MITAGNAVRRAMGIILLMFAGLIPSEIFGYDLSGISVRKNEKRNMFPLHGPDKKYIGHVMARPKSEFPKLKVSAEPEALVIDTRELFGDPAKKQNAMFYFNKIDQDLIVRKSSDGKIPEETNRLTVEVQSDIPSQMNLLFEGSTETDGKKKHFWKAKSFFLTGKLQTLTFEQVFPANLKTLHIRIDVRKPCRLEIRKIDFAKVQVEKKKIDASKNLILNGGAERGWTGIVSTPLRNLRSSVTGKHIIWNGKEIKNEIRVFLDPETKYEGNYSFRVERPAGEVNGGLKFAPVPYIVGEPASISFYAKAEKPIMIGVSFFVSSGNAAATYFKAGTEWKKYEFYMPAWGAKGKGIRIFGNITDFHPLNSRFATPIINPAAPGKVWIDNVAYSVGGHAIYKGTDSLYITHKLNKDSSYYFNDEAIMAEVSFRNASKNEFSGVASYELIDVFGKSISSKKIGEISIPADQSVKKNIELTLPADFRGPFHAVFKVKSGKEVYSDVAYAGVIERGGKLNKRIGLEINARQNFRIAAEYLRDFRIGSIRVGAASGGVKGMPIAMQNAEFMKQNGFDIMFGTPIGSPEKMKTVMEIVENILTEHGKYIDVLETGNEANITRATIEQNRKQIRELYDLIKKYNLKCKLAGPTTCHTDFSWTASILASAEGKLLDIVTEHPYRELPELPDYADDAVSMRKLIDLHKPGIPHHASESGRVQQCMPGNGGFVGKNSIIASARDIRNIIQGFSGGVERYYHFIMYIGPYGNDWNVIYAGTPASNGVPRPNPTLYALRTLSDRLEQAKCVKRIRLGADYRCPVFDHGNKRTAIIWKWNGKPGTLTFKTEDAKQFTAYNFFGTEIPAGKLEMNEFPIYLDTALSAEETEKAIRRAALISEGSAPFEFDSAILGENRFAVEVRNRTAKDLKNIKVSVDTPNAVSGSAKQTIAGIGPEAKARTEFELKKAISTKDCKLKVSVREQSSKVKKSEDLNLRAILVRKTGNPLVIDGDLSDWPKNAAVVKLDKRNAVKVPRTTWGENEDKVRAELRYAWDDRFLYTAVTVFKPEFYPVRDMKDIVRAWKSDSVQIAYDTLRNAIPGTTGLGDDDFEYTFARCGGKDVVFRNRASSGIHDSLPKSIGVIRDEVGFAVKKYDDRVVYEIAFSKRSVSPFNLAPYSVMRAGLLVNINNGKERAGWLELTPGIGQSPKRPDQWMDLVLLP